MLNIEIATVLVVLALFVRLLPRLTGLQQGLQALNVLLPALDNIHRLRETARAFAEPSDSRPLPLALRSAAPQIEFSEVSAMRGDVQVLDRVDIELPQGKIVALVGPSGSGKSTFVDVLLGLLPISAGRVEIGGIALQDLPLAAWRRTIGYVAQDTTLLSGSVADNVLLGSNGASHGLDLALEKAAADFVTHLENGVNTQVGDRGVRLSGGERQRLGLARAIVVPRRLYILDEATSALDAETEAEILQTVSQLAGDATVLVIAHRFTAVRGADLIHVIENGRVVESGDWETLDQPGSRFFALKRLQDMTNSEPETS